MVRQHRQLSGHEFEQTQGDSGGQRSSTCYSPWDHRESDTTQRLDNKQQHPQGTGSKSPCRYPNPWILKALIYNGRVHLALHIHRFNHLWIQTTVDGPRSVESRDVKPLKECQLYIYLKNTCRSRPVQFKPIFFQGSTILLSEILMHCETLDSEIS